jgi:hypothetical protein
VFLKEHAPFIDELKHNKLRIKLHLRVIFLVAATVSCLLLSLLAVDAAAAGVLEWACPFINDLEHNKHKIKLQLWVIFLDATTVSYLLLKLLVVDASAADVLTLSLLS